MRKTGGKRAWKKQVNAKSGRVFSESVVSLHPAFVCLYGSLPSGYLTVYPGGTPREGCLATEMLRRVEVLRSCAAHSLL